MRRAWVPACLLVALLAACGGRRGGREVAPPASRVAELDEISRLEDARDVGDGRLVQLLAHEDARVRARAALAIGRVADPAAFPPLREALRDAEPAVRGAAALALGLAADEEAEPALLRRLALDDGRPERVADLEALGRLGGERALPALVASLAEREPEVRAAAARALGNYGYRGRLAGRLGGAEAALATALTDAGVEVRAAAAYALFRIRAPGSAAPVLAALRTALRDPDPDVRALAVQALAARAPGEREPLLAALADSDWRVRVQAARALPRTGDAGVEAVAAFAASAWKHLAGDPAKLHGPELHAVLAAIEALAKHSARPHVLAAAEELYAAAAPQDGAPPLTARARALVQCAAGAILEREGKPALERCGGPGDAGLPAWRKQALLAATLGDARAPAAERAHRLEELFKARDPRVRAAVADAAGNLDDPRAQKLLRDALAGDDPGVIAAAADALRRAAEERRRRDLAVVPRLCELTTRLRSADNPEALVSAIDALKAMNDPRAITALQPVLVDPNVTVRGHARAALRWLTGRDPVVPAPQHPQPPPGDPWALAGKRVTARVGTERGELVLALFPDEAPRAVASFTALARRGFYDGLSVHRVVPDFVVQGGDPRGDGYGGPGYTLRCEVGGRRFGRGAVGIALAGKDTGGSQFFVTQSPQPHLDGRYTVIGQLERGQEALDALQAGDRITTVKVEVR
ncbi:MAG TPA: HEAT repeat domain-containing protein [Polyangia bacterium]|jgi:cyclophilin family peptidyl-prolyl cis-trans isomerase/HEAT repeat protein